MNDRRFYLFCQCILILIIFGQSAFSQLPLKRDDFIGDERRIWWQYDLEGPALPARQIDNTLVLEVPEGDENSDPWTNTSFWDGHNHYFGATLTMRCRAVNPARPGSRGWGFWKTTPLAEPTQNAWFMEVWDDPAYPDYDPVNVWWRASVVNHILFPDTIPQVDITEDIHDWHTYKVVWDPNAADKFILSIDGVETMRSSEVFINQGLSLQSWNDNLVYYQDPDFNYYNRGWSGGLSDLFIVDYAEILTAPHPGFSEMPSGTKLLREVPREMGSGASQSLWKTYNLNSTGGNYVVLATARAEQYGSWGDDDDIRLIVDGQDYGWNTANSFNGTLLDGDSKTLVIQKAFTPGAKTIEVYGDQSPLLNDVTVLGSDGGNLILNQEFNETAPGGSDYLWKTINFTCETGEISIYVSGAADADSLPGDKGADPNDFEDDSDDDLRLVLNGNDYGYQNDNALWGNRLFSEPKSILIQEQLTEGAHTLQIYADRTPTLFNVVIYGENEDDPLPVTLSSFNAFWQDGSADIEWTTQSEINNLGFNIYRAIDFADNEHELDFIRINRDLIEGAGTTNQINEYRFRDGNAPDDPDLILWYKLEQLDINGQSSVFGPVKLHRNPQEITGYKLFQNYPNPFNGATTISFNMAETAPARLDIYDLQGRLIKTLFQETKSQGIHNAFWDGTDRNRQKAASGVYLYRFSTEKYRLTKKLLLVN